MPPTNGDVKEPCGISPSASALADKLKAYPGIDNPHALAKWMTDRSECEAEPLQAWERFKASPDFKAYSEAVSASSAGQLQHPQKPPQEAQRVALSYCTHFREADGGINEATREVPVIIIKEGMGNKVDRHFYSAALLAKVCPMFEGVKAYADHPTKTQEKDQPERSIRQIVGYYGSPRIAVIEGKTAIVATLKIIEGKAYDWAWDLVKEAAAFAKKYPDKELVGISINAFGASHQEETADGIMNVVDDFAEVGSADIVTQAGAGGGFRLREAVRKALAREGVSQGGTVKELLQKHGEGLSALRDKVKGVPEHEAAYGPAIEELVAHHGEMVKKHEALIAAEPPAKEPPAKEPPAAEPPAKGGEDKEGQLLHLPEADKAFAKAEADYAAGKLTEGERKIFELVKAKRAELAIQENARMVGEAIKESGIPEAYAVDLATLCAGKAEAEVKNIVEARKALITPLLANKAQGAGASGTGADSKKSGLSEKLAEAGVKLKE